MPKNKNANLIFWIIGLLILAALLSLRPAEEGSNAVPIGEAGSSAPAAEAGSLLQCRFYNELDFLTHQNNAPEALEQMELQADIQAAIIPHHLTAGAYTAGFLSGLKAEDYEAIVLLAPNHEGIGGDFVYTMGTWQSMQGQMPCARDLTAELLDSNYLKARQNDELLQSDHSIAALIPYLCKYLPDTPIVSVLITANAPLEKVTRLAEQIAARDSVLLLCSVDFSHYLQLKEAKERDAASIKAINSANLAAIASFNNEYCDSVPCLTAFLTYTQLKGLKHSLAWQGSSHELAGYGINDYVSGGITTYQIWQAAKPNE